MKPLSGSSNKADMRSQGLFNFKLIPNLAFAFKQKGMIGIR